MQGIILCITFMDETAFNLNVQNSSLDSKIVVALERVSEAFRVALWDEAKEHTLSPIQMQILIFLAFHTQNQYCKVGYLAKEFNLTKATISDAVKALSQKKLIEKNADPLDTRSYSLTLTPKGKKLAYKTSNFILPLQKPISQLSQTQKEDLFNALVELIYKLTKSSIITLQRMCLTCEYYQNTGGGYCNLLKQKLPKDKLRIDCPEHSYTD